MLRPTVTNKQYGQQRMADNHIMYVSGASTINNIGNAMKDIMAKTCIRFFPRTTERDYIYFQNTPTGYSSSIWHKDTQRFWNTVFEGAILLLDELEGHNVYLFKLECSLTITVFKSLPSFTNFCTPQVYTTNKIGTIVTHTLLLIGLIYLQVIIFDCKS